MEYLFRFLIGGATVSLFAVLGDVFRPRSFAGLFAAAPTIALATLGLEFVTGPRRVTAVEGRSMILGAVALGVYSLLVGWLLLKHNWSTLSSALVALPAWFAAAFGLWAIFLRGGAP